MKLYALEKHAKVAIFWCNTYSYAMNKILPFVRSDVIEKKRRDESRFYFIYIILLSFTFFFFLQLLASIQRQTS